MARLSNRHSRARLDPPGMSPDEFMIWLKGVADILAGGTPTPEQWAKIRETAEAVTGRVVAQKMLNPLPFGLAPKQDYKYHDPLDDLRKFNEFMEQHTGKPVPLPTYTISDSTVPSIKY